MPFRENYHKTEFLFVFEAPLSVTLSFYIFIIKKMYNQEEKIECALGNREFCFMAGQERRKCCVFISDIPKNFLFTCHLILILRENTHKLFF